MNVSEVEDVERLCNKEYKRGKNMENTKQKGSIRLERKYREKICSVFQVPERKWPGGNKGQRTERPDRPIDEKNVPKQI